MTIENFECFYQSPVGRFTKRSIISSLGLASHQPHQKILAIGYLAPFFEAISTRKKVGLIPKTLYKVKMRDYLTFPFESHKPFPVTETTFDCAYVFHSLEYTPSPQTFLKEIWRTLRPGGKLVVLLPTFKKEWSVKPYTGLPPGQHYLLKDIQSLFEENFFSITFTHGIIFSSAHHISRFPLLCQAFEKALGFFPIVQGGHFTLIYAQKNIAASWSSPDLLWQRA